MAKRQSISERFWSKVGPPDENGCRPWLAYCDKDGYGRFTPWPLPPVPAHGFAWRLTYHGPTKPGAAVFRHSCDNPWCCEPSHVYPGTNTENLADMTAKGRRPRGETHANSRLTEALVAEARAAIAKGEARTSIAKRMGVCLATISYLSTGSTWRHVP